MLKCFEKNKLLFSKYLTDILTIFRWTRHGCQRSPVSQLILSALLCFGAGVLLATALTHMLPEVRSKIEALMEEPEASPFLKALPLTEVLLAAGFFIVYGLDEVSDSWEQKFSSLTNVHHRELEIKWIIYFNLQ